MTGIIQRVNVNRGFGFIRRDDGERDLFFHVSELRGIPFDDQAVARIVEFDAMETERGLQAANVRPAP